MKEEPEYAEILVRDYATTPLARGNPEAKASDFAGYWPLPAEFPIELRYVFEGKYRVHTVLTINSSEAFSLPFLSQFDRHRTRGL